MLIRSFKLSDYVAVTQLLMEVLSEACFEETMEAFARQLSWDCELVLVAVDAEDRIVGILIGTIDDNKGYYYRIAVAPDCRRKGIGKSLIQTMKQRFLQRKVSRILINADKHNEMVLPVYESLGYRANDFMRSTHRLKIVNG